MRSEPVLFFQQDHIDVWPYLQEPSRDGGADDPASDDGDPIWRYHTSAPIAAQPATRFRW